MWHQKTNQISQIKASGWQSRCIHKKTTCYLVYQFSQSENSQHKGLIEQGESGGIVSQRLVSPSQGLHLPPEIPPQHSAEVKWNAVGELFHPCEPPRGRLSTSPRKKKKHIVCWTQTEDRDGDWLLMLWISRCSHMNIMQT